MMNLTIVESILLQVDPGNWLQYGTSGAMILVAIAFWMAYKQLSKEKELDHLREITSLTAVNEDRIRYMEGQFERMLSSNSELSDKLVMLCEKFLIQSEQTMSFIRESNSMSEANKETLIRLYQEGTREVIEAINGLKTHRP